MAVIRQILEHTLQIKKDNPNNVGISDRIMSSLTHEEFAAFVDQLRARVDSVNKQSEAPKKKYHGVGVPSSVLQQLSDEESKALADQLLRHDEPAVKKKGPSPEPDEMPDRTKIDLSPSTAIERVPKPRGRKITHRPSRAV